MPSTPNPGVKLLREQEVEPLFGTHMSDEWALLVERFARVSHASDRTGDPGDAKMFIRELWGMGHRSVFEATMFVFRVTTSRAVANEMVRHRLLSFCQESTRYVNMKAKAAAGDLEFFAPPDLRDLPDDDTRVQHFVELCESAESEYVELVDQLDPQNARDALPLSLATNICVKGNYRSLVEMVEKRAAPDVHPDFRWVASRIGEAIQFF